MVRMFALTLVAAIAIPAASSTIVVDFEELAHSEDWALVSNPLISKGVEFSNSSPLPTALSVWGKNHPANADPGGATLNNNRINTTTTVSLIGGGPFTLVSIDLADAYNIGWGGDVRFTFNYADLSQMVTTVTVDNLFGLETFTFNQSNLLSFAYLPLTTDGPWIQVDNVVIGVGGNGIVPEPAVWGMMIAGFGLVGAVARRRRRYAAA